MIKKICQRMYSWIKFAIEFIVVITVLFIFLIIFRNEKIEF